MRSEILDSCLGSALTSAKYVMFPWESEPDQDSRVDAVPHAVILGFGKREVQVRWVLQPPVERLVIEPYTPWSEDDVATTVDVGARWPNHLSRTLVNYRVGMQRVESGREPWALLLEFETASPLLIAQGELTAGVPSYLPDSLIVTSDPLVAMAYAPRASEGSVWPQ